MLQGTVVLPASQSGGCSYNNWSSVDSRKLSTYIPGECFL